MIESIIIEYQDLHVWVYPMNMWMESDGKLGLSVYKYIEVIAWDYLYPLNSILAQPQVK